MKRWLAKNRAWLLLVLRWLLAIEAVAVVALLSYDHLDKFVDFWLRPAPLISLLLLAAFLLQIYYPGGWKTFFLHIHAEKKPNPQENKPITVEVLLLAGLGLSIFFSAFGFYESQCSPEAKAAFCGLVKESANAFLPLLTTLVTAPTLLFWWLRRDKHRCQDLKHQASRLMTERFASAVQLLGHESADVRLGAIYSLERLARDSREDHWTVMETLAAYVREHAPLKDDAYYEENMDKPIPKLPVNVQAALTVIGRRKKEWREEEKREEDQTLNLSNCDLRGADLSAHGEEGKEPDGHFERADFRNCRLEWANMRKAHFEGAQMEKAILNGANLNFAQLEWANLNFAHLEGADLTETHLEAADLREAHLEGADLWEAHLEGADLWEAHLEKAFLQAAHLEGAVLWEAHLEGARLEGAYLRDSNLEAADLGGAHLEGANLTSIEIDNNTIFTDATYDKDTIFPTSWGSTREEQEAEAQRRGMKRV